MNSAQKKNDEPNVIMCYRIVEIPAHHVTHDARIYKCAECNEDIWCSASSFVQAGGDARLVCMACIRDFMASQPEEERLAIPTDYQLGVVNRNLERRGLPLMKKEDMPKMLDKLKRLGIVPKRTKLVDE